MHVVRELVMSCALVTCQCELRSRGCVLCREVFAETERGAKYSGF